MLHSRFDAIAVRFHVEPGQSWASVFMPIRHKFGFYAVYGRTKGNRHKNKKGQTPESDIPPSYCATRRYINVNLGFCVRFSTLIGQIGRVPLFGGEPRRYIRSRLFRLAVTSFWRALTASWRQKGRRKQRSFLGPLARQNCLPFLRP